jgi:two-component system, sensor histidine kinase LadS
MVSIKKVTAAICLIFICGILPAQEVLKLEYLLDETGSMTRETIVKEANFQSFNLNESIRHGFNEYAAVWCRLVIKNPKEDIAIYRVVTDNPHLDYVTLYKGDTVLVAGDRVISNPHNLLSASFQIRLQPGETKDLLIKVQKHLSYMTFSLDVVPDFHFQKRFTRELIINTLFLGFFISFLLLNFFLAIASSKAVNFFYTLHVAGLVTYVLITTGYFKYAISPHFLNMSEFRLFLSIVNPTTFSIFILLFLGTYKRLPFLYRTSYVLAGGNLILLLMFFIFYLFDIVTALNSMYIIAGMFAVALVFMSLLITLLSLNYNKRKSIYVLSAFVVVFFSVFLLILEYYSIIRISINVEWLLLSAMYEVILFGILLATEFYRAFSENMKLQAELLKKKQDELEAFSKGRIKERKQIASVLHDQMNSQLLATHMLLRQDKKCQALLNLKRLGKDIRFLSHSLMPLALEHGLLMDALQLQLKFFRESFPGKTIELYNFGFPERIDYPWIFDIYLVINEALQNAIKHSKSDMVIIETYDHETTFNFQIVDNGNGFDRQAVSEGFGLNHSRQIVEGYLGSFEIDSAPGKGTTLMISIPK